MLRPLPTSDRGSFRRSRRSTHRTATRPPTPTAAVGAAVADVSSGRTGRSADTYPSLTDRLPDSIGAPGPRGRPGRRGRTPAGVSRPRAGRRGVQRADRAPFGPVLAGTASVASIHDPEGRRRRRRRSRVRPTAGNGEQYRPRTNQRPPSNERTASSAAAVPDRPVACPVARSERFGDVFDPPCSTTENMTTHLMERPTRPRRDAQSDRTNAAAVDHTHV